VSSTHIPVLTPISGATRVEFFLPTIRAVLEFTTVQQTLLQGFASIATGAKVFVTTSAIYDMIFASLFIAHFPVTLNATFDVSNVFNTCVAPYGMAIRTPACDHLFDNLFPFCSLFFFVLQFPLVLAPDTEHYIVSLL
jgi:hypothetical protein